MLTSIWDLFRRVSCYIYNRIWNGLRSTKIQIRLMVSFVLLSSVPLFITGYFSYSKSSSAIKSKISTYSLELMNQVGNNIDDQMARLINDSISVEFSDILQDTLKSYEKMTDWEKLDLNYKMHRTFIKNFPYWDYVSNIILVTGNRDEIAVYGGRGLKLNLKEEYIDKLFERVIPHDGSPIWTVFNHSNVNHYVKIESRDEEGILLNRAIKEIEGDKRDSLLIIKISKKLFSNIYKDMDINKDSDVFVINSQGIVVSSVNPDIEFGNPYKYSDLTDRIMQDNPAKGQVFNYNLSGKKYLVAAYPLQYADWHVVTTIPYSYLNHESAIHGLSIMFLGFACLILAVLLSLLISRSISQPLSELISSMNRAKTGDFEVRIIDHSKDEVAEVTDNYHHLLKAINRLMSEVREMEGQKRLAEFKALQAQINPHFLSNTLNTIKSMASRQKANNIADIITSLIQLLHVCMGKEEELIYIHEEIEYIKAYINIQEYKHYNRFDVHFEIDEDILYYKIPKFLCQPIVENAIIHGIGTSGHHGIIIIKGYRLNDDIKIIVTDNGIGIDKNILNELHETNDNKRSKLTGIGIKNVDQRIRMFFGDNYGLKIESVPNLFTNVEITIPIIQEDKQCLRF